MASPLTNLKEGSMLLAVFVVDTSDRQIVIPDK
jgi:hypothetical protein